MRLGQERRDQRPFSIGQIGFVSQAVHIAVPDQASAPSWNHSGLGHSTLFGTGS
jgi:hypothetical protein